jgi:hypothetical protein
VVVTLPTSLMQGKPIFLCSPPNILRAHPAPKEAKLPNVISASQGPDPCSEVGSQAWLRRYILANAPCGTLHAHHASLPCILIASSWHLWSVETSDQNDVFERETPSPVLDHLQIGREETMELPLTGWCEAFSSIRPPQTIASPPWCSIIFCILNLFSKNFTFGPLGERILKMKS